MAALLEALSRERMAASELAEIHERFRTRSGFIAEAISALGQLDPDTACRAAWMLRKGAVAGALAGPDLARIAELVDGSGHWIYRLQLCQLFAASGCPTALREQVFPFLRRCFDDRLIVIRAWALTAMVRFHDDPAYRREIDRCVRQARRDPSKAMQARLRHLDRG